MHAIELDPTNIRALVHLRRVSRMPHPPRRGDEGLGRFVNPDPAALDEIVAGLKQSCARIAESGGLAYEMTEATHHPATKFDEACVSAVQTAAERLGYSHRDIVSHAGHDA